jgi:ABC-type uncharacterized transport system fused permease/ATPase subunit
MSRSGPYHLLVARFTRLQREFRVLRDSYRAALVRQGDMLNEIAALREEIRETRMLYERLRQIDRAQRAEPAGGMPLQ